MVWLWLGRPGQEVLTQGLQRDLAEEEANQAGERVIAPPCPACGKPVADKEWRKHGYEDHDIREMVRPYGEPDAREAFFTAYDTDQLEQKVAIWQGKHPGVSLVHAGEGKDVQRKIVWRRYFLKAAVKALFVAAVLFSTREPMDPWPPPAPPDTGCTMIITTRGPIVICR